MLRTLDSIHGYRVTAQSQRIGDVVDAYFDDGRWKVRYIVAETTDRSSRQALWFAPDLADSPDDEHRELRVGFTAGQIEEMAVTDPETRDADPSRRRLHDERGWPRYWIAPILGRGAEPVAFTTPEGAGSEPVELEADPHLRSVSEVGGYAIVATDGSAGRVSGFLCDDASWEIRYLLGTDGSGAGGDLFIDPARIGSVDREHSVVRVDLSVDAIREASRNAPRSIG